LFIIARCNEYTHGGGGRVAGKTGYTNKIFR
jgi:hypothetical protein